MKQRVLCSGLGIKGNWNVGELSPRGRVSINSKKLLLLGLLKMVQRIKFVYWKCRIYKYVMSFPSLEALQTLSSTESSSLVTQFLFWLAVLQKKPLMFQSLPAKCSFQMFGSGSPPLRPQRRKSEKNAPFKLLRNPSNGSDGTADDSQKTGPFRNSPQKMENFLKTCVWMGMWVDVGNVCLAAPNWKIQPNKVLCQEHFTSDLFKKNL